MPMQEYIEKFKQFEQAYEGGPLTELEIPNTVVGELNKYWRYRHKT